MIRARKVSTYFLRPTRNIQTRFLSYASTYIKPTSSLKVLVDDAKLKAKKSGVDPASVVIAATASHAAELIDISVNLHEAKTKSQNNDLLTQDQLIAFAVDSIPFGAQSNAVSVFVSDRKIPIESSFELDTQFGDDNQVNLRSGAALSERGVVSGRRVWKLTEGVVGFEIEGKGNTQQIGIPLANTFFQNGLPNTLIVDDKIYGSVQLGSILSSDFELNHKSSFAPLRKLNTGAKILTSCKSNMLKTIDNVPAAGFLERCADLQVAPTSTASSAERRVFVKLANKGFYEITAGGGGSWSPRASMLVIDPSSSPEAGDSVEFYLSDSSIKLSKEEREVVKNNQNTLNFVFECGFVQEELPNSISSETVSYEKDTVIEGLWGFGSEKGFIVGEKKYNAPGEMVHYLQEQS